MRRASERGGAGLRMRRNAGTPKHDALIDPGSRRRSRTARLVVRHRRGASAGRVRGLSRSSRRNAPRVGGGGRLGRADQLPPRAAAPSGKDYSDPRRDRGGSRHGSGHRVANRTERHARAGNAGVKTSGKSDYSRAGSSKAEARAAGNCAAFSGGEGTTAGPADSYSRGAAAFARCRRAACTRGDFAACARRSSAASAC